MADRFEPEARRILQERLRLPRGLTADLTPSATHLAIAEVQEILHLPEPSCRAWLKPDRWVLGGAVLHWLRSGIREEGSGPLDYDFYFSTIEAFNRGIADFLAAGFTFSCFQLWGDRCPFCGLAGSLEIREAPGPAAVPLVKAGCRVCEPADVAGRWGSGLRITAESLAASGLISLDLLSPRGELFQLAAIAFEPTPSRMIASMDFSVCQLGLDDRNLYFGPHTWTDLLDGRLRVENLNRACYSRLRKYQGKGFSPDPATLARVIGFHLYLQVREWLARPGGA